MCIYEFIIVFSIDILKWKISILYVSLIILFTQYCKKLMTNFKQFEYPASKIEVQKNLRSQTRKTIHKENGTEKICYSQLTLILGAIIQRRLLYDWFHSNSLQYLIKQRCYRKTIEIDTYPDLSLITSTYIL